MSKDKDGSAIQFVTLVDSGAARHRVADPGAEVSHAQTSTPVSLKKRQETATRRRSPRSAHSRKFGLAGRRLQPVLERKAGYPRFGCRLCQTTRPYEPKRHFCRRQYNQR